MNEELNKDIKEVKEILLRLLHGIQTRDNDTYKELVSETLTCFEPESHGLPVDGLKFHLFFGEHIAPAKNYNLELVRPIIRVYGNTAYASYTLLKQVKKDDEVIISSVNETRIFHKESDIWKMVHFHRSAIK